MVGSYKAHNVFYLRISQAGVLALSLHLDPRHTMWMNDDILERLLSALRTRITTKLREESGSDKKARVDVFRGAGYQMAYYFRSTSQRHAVLLKDRQVVQPELRFGGQVEDEDEKPEELKPTLKVNYTGFSIFGRTLIVVVEPWPALPDVLLTPAPADRAEVRQLSATPAPSRRSRSTVSVTPRPDHSGAALFRSETPASQADEEDIDAFRLRSQSVVGGLEGDEDELPGGSMMARAASGDRGVQPARGLDIAQYLGP